MAWDVLVFYAAAAVWAALLVVGFRRRSFTWFVWFGLALLVVLNGRYFLEGPPAGIAFFVGIYDVFDNIGLASDEGAGALAACADNACTVWGDRYVQHPSWGVAFYDRFLDGPQLRTNLLYGHIAFNSLAFLLMHYQLARPGTGSRSARHRLVGRLWGTSLALGTAGAIWLASEHHAVSEYGGWAAQIGFYSMSGFVASTAVVAVRAIRQGDQAQHRRWMIRHAGSVWGSFWLFRVMLIFTGPLFREVETASILLSVWLSAPLGILLAEWLRRTMLDGPDRSTVSPTPTPTPTPA